MEKLTGRVAVVTGAASGIGRGLIDRFAAEGMRVVLADIEEAPLAQALAEVRATGAEAIAVRTDVTSESDLQALADRTMEAFGAVHVVVNNAGVEGGALFSDMSLKTWEWVMQVNFWGVLNGCRVFLPLLRQEDEGYIINTASHAAFATGLHTFHAYIASKAAVAAMTANLAMELRDTDPTIGVSLLVPGVVRTNMNDSERNRPADVPATDTDPLRLSIRNDIERVASTVGLLPEDVAEIVVQGMRERRHYLLTDPELTQSAVAGTLDWMRTGIAPEPPMEEDKNRLAAGDAEDLPVV